MLKKRILILSGKIYRGVVKLTNLEASYLEIDFTAHFLPPGDYIFMIRIGEFVERLHFDGDKLYVKMPFGLTFEGILEAAVIELSPFAVLMSASTEKGLSLFFNRLLEEYINPVISKRNKEPSSSNNIAEKPTTPLNGTLPELPNEPSLNQNNDDAKEPSTDAEALKKSFMKTLEEELKKPPKTQKSFFDDIKESVTDFFEKYPPYEELAAIVPFSKWVKVDTEDTFYVVGLLFNTGGITHICYGIPGEYSVKPPSDILTEWLPLNTEEWDKSGFWMIYQNAETGQV